MQTLTNLTAPMKLNNGVEIPGLGFGTYQTPADVTYDVVTEP